LRNGRSGGIPATAISGTRHCAAQHCAGGAIESSITQALNGIGYDAAVNVGDEQILPHGQAQFATAELIRNGSERAHLIDGQATYGDRNADVVQVGLALRVDANVTGAINGPPCFAFFGRTANKGKGEAFFGFSNELLHAPAIDKVFEARLLAVGAVAVRDEHADHGRGNSKGLIGPDQYSAVGCELLVAGDAAQQNAEIDAGRHVAALADAHCLETDVVGVSHDADGSTAIESNIEFSRKFIEIAQVEDVEVQCLRKRSDVELPFCSFAENSRYLSSIEKSPGPSITPFTLCRMNGGRFRSTSVLYQGLESKPLPPSMFHVVVCVGVYCRMPSNRISSTSPDDGVKTGTAPSGLLRRG